jgi:excisionase family DNA binding protein
MTRDIGTGAVAEIIRCSVRHVTKLADRGQLPHYRLPGSLHRRYRLDEVLAFAERAGIRVPEGAVERAKAGKTLQSHAAV